MWFFSSYLSLFGISSDFSLIFISLECKWSYNTPNDYCDQTNFVPECDYDRDDCQCPYPEFIGDSVCDPQNNLRICNYDGLDCGKGCPLNLALYLGNGACNINANTSKCLFDGGDCLWINLVKKSVSIDSLVLSAKV